MCETDNAPDFGELDARSEDVEIFMDGPDMVVRTDGWEYFLVETNGPCHPSVDPATQYVRFYDSPRDGKAVVYIEEHWPDGDVQEWEVKFEVRDIKHVNAEPEVRADGGVELTDMDEGEEVPARGADLRTELSVGEDLRVRFSRGSEAAELDVRVVDVHHESTAGGHARVEVEAEVLNSTRGSILMESEREDFVSDWSQLNVLMSGGEPDAVVEHLARLEESGVDAGEDESDSGETLEDLKRQLEGASEYSREEAGVPAEGERVAVTYESVYAERDKVLTATVETVEHAPGSLGGRLWHVYLVPEGERDERREAYTEDEARPPRRLTVMPEAESVTLETRNGGRWNRLNAPATNAEVEVLGEDEEPEREPIGTVAVTVRHSRCAGTTLLTVDSVEEAEDLRGRVLACPHCHGEDEDGNARRHEVGTEFSFEAIRPLTTHPDHVDTIDELDDHEVVEHHASPRRWDVYLKAGVKGRNRAHLAEDLGVAEGTVYRHVHDAREAIREVTGQ